MRRSPNLAMIFIVLTVIFLAEYYTFQAFKSVLNFLNIDKKRLWYILYFSISIGFVVLMFLSPSFKLQDKSTYFRNTFILIAMSYFLTKIIIAAYMLIGDIVQFITHIFQKNIIHNENYLGKPYTRSQFFTLSSLVVGGFFLSSFLLGTRNKYRYKIFKQNLDLKNVPDALKSLKIIQISDIHSGSFDDLRAVKHGIDKINDLKPDIVFFTGDLVNYKSNEIDPYINIFKQIKATYGVYSILGNHDYGDYYNWDSKEEKEKDFEEFIEKHQLLGWKLLRNEHAILFINGKKLGIIGVENWGKSHNFPKYGDLDKAMKDMPDTDFNILLSHDPSHWREKVIHKTNIPLTLSGHTHGMQMGIEIPGFKWSPSKYLYPEWAGVYVENNQLINVNRGFGFLGYPGRLGIMPEITLISL